VRRESLTEHIALPWSILGQRFSELGRPLVEGKPQGQNKNTAAGECSLDIKHGQRRKRRVPLILKRQRS
jgi:hypothetical protein